MKAKPVIRHVAVVTTFAALSAFTGRSHAVEADYSLRLRVGGLAEGERDLGLGNAGDTLEGFIEANPALRLRFSPDWGAYVRGQALVPTGNVVFDENEQPVQSKSFVGLREAWLEYGGLTSYPGEVLRFGLQRLRKPDGQWLDRDIESLRFIFDTTLIQTDFGIAQQFETYRTDGVDLTPNQRDRGYAFATASGQLRPGHFIGVRGFYSEDWKDAPAVGTATDAETKLVNRSLGWLAVRAESGYFDFQQNKLINYWAEVGLINGDRQIADTAPASLDPFAPAAGTVTNVRSNNVSAYAADLGLRLRFQTRIPLAVGTGYSYGQGKAGGNGYEQTGLQSNRSRFTGTRSVIHRYNEAYRAELSNLQVITGFVSIPGERYDASFIYNNFRRDSASAPVITRGLDIQPQHASQDLGHGFDVVLTKYFAGVGRVTSFDDDLRSNVRLRASAFDPGAAYGVADQFQYRVLLETTLWF